MRDAISEFLPELLDFTEMLLLDFSRLLLLDFGIAELLDFGATEELLSLREDDEAIHDELLLDPSLLLRITFCEELLDLTTEDDDVTVVEEELFTSLREVEDDEAIPAFEELDVATEELDAVELELLETFIAATTLSINLSVAVHFNTGYLSLSDCVQAEPSKPWFL